MIKATVSIPSPRSELLQDTVSLNLAVLLWEQESTDELKEIAAEMRMAFESREIHREALAALALFPRACMEERGTKDLVRHVAAVCGGGTARLPRQRRPEI